MKKNNKVDLNNNNIFNWFKQCSRGIYRWIFWLYKNPIITWLFATFFIIMTLSCISDKLFPVVLGSMISGGLTLFGVLLTLDHYSKTEISRNRPYLFPDLTKTTHNILLIEKSFIPTFLKQHNDQILFFYDNSPNNIGKVFCFYIKLALTNYGLSLAKNVLIKFSDNKLNQQGSIGTIGCDDPYIIKNDVKVCLGIAQNQTIRIDILLLFNENFYRNGSSLIFDKATREKNKKNGTKDIYIKNFYDLFFEYTDKGCIEYSESNVLSVDFYRSDQKEPFDNINII